MAATSAIASTQGFQSRGATPARCTHEYASVRPNKTAAAMFMSAS
jgi:hypothetical protein